MNSSANEWMSFLESYVTHVDSVLRLIYDASGADLYSSRVTEIDKRKHHYEISVSKKDPGNTLCASMVTPRFPVRIHVFCGSRGSASKCVGFLCSPLLKTEGNDAGKGFPMNIEVSIGDMQSMTDFLLLHLSYGCAAARYMLYMMEAMPKHPQIPTISIDVASKQGFVFKFGERSATLKIKPDMSVALSCNDREIALPKLRNGVSAADTSTGLYGGINEDAEWNKYLEHQFCGAPDRDVGEGSGIKTHHPTTMTLCAAIVESLFFPAV
jgi:hypothetical protein